MKLYYVVQGCSADDSPFEVTGEVEGDSPVDPYGFEKAARASFFQLTRGNAVFGRPGQGCHGPYKIDKLTLNTVESDPATESDIKRLRTWIDDLQSGMYVNCVYCGHRYGPNEMTPVSMADALKAHVEQCPKHPMSELRLALVEMILLAQHAEYPEGDDPALARAKKLVGL